MKQKSNSHGWDLFDSIYCISVKQRTDRREEVLRQFDRLGIAKRVQFMLVERHPTNSEQGIYESHVKCLREGLSAGARHMVVFEDDVVFERYDPARFEEGIAFLRNHPDWAILFLGCLVKRSRPTDVPAIRRVEYRCLTHAYAISQSFALNVIEKPWQDIPYDDMLSRLNAPYFVVNPTFAFQSGAVSDNDRRKTLDRFRRWFGGLRRIQKGNEWYHRNKAWVIALHVAGLGLLLWIVVEAVARNS